MIPYVFPSDHTALLHTICDPLSGDAFYPDILFAHEFAEEALLDTEAYRTICDLTASHSLSNYIFFVAPDDQIPVLYDFAQKLTKALSAVSFEAPATDSQYITKFAEDLHLSVSMQRSFLQLMDYYQAMEGNPSDLLQPFYTEYDLPVKTKKEGMELYERIRNLILG